MALRQREKLLFLSDEGPMLETLDYTIRIGSIPTFLYFDLYLYSAYAYFSVPKDRVTRRWDEPYTNVVVMLSFYSLCHLYVDVMTSNVLNGKKNF